MVAALVSRSVSGVTRPTGGLFTRSAAGWSYCAMARLRGLARLSDCVIGALFDARGLDFAREDCGASCGIGCAAACFLFFFAERGMRTRIKISRDAVQLSMHQFFIHRAEDGVGGSLAQAAQGRVAHNRAIVAQQLQFVGGNIGFL